MQILYAVICKERSWKRSCLCTMGIVFSVKCGKILEGIEFWSSGGWTRFSFPARKCPISLTIGQYWSSFNLAHKWELLAIYSDRASLKAVHSSRNTMSFCFASIMRTRFLQGNSHFKEHKNLLKSSKKMMHISFSHQYFSCMPACG